MPATQIRVEFLEVKILDSDSWGKSDWSFKATISGYDVGDSREVFEVVTRDIVVLHRSGDFDVADCAPGENIPITFEATSNGALGSSSKGVVTLTLHAPIESDVDVQLVGSDEGMIFEQRHYVVHVKVTVLARTALTPTPKVAPVLMPGGAPGDEFTVVDVGSALPRVEVHPVIPVPQVDQLPPRPPSKPGSTPGQNTPFVAPVVLTGKVAVNALANPSLIAVLDPSAPFFEKRAARLAVTYVQPKDLDVTKVTWWVKRGPVVIHGSNTGLSVLAYGTAAADDPAEVEVRWGGESGPVLCVFRAFVGDIKAIPYRANIICGASKRPRVTPSDVRRHIKDANVLLYQAGILLVPDTSTEVFDGAAVDPACAGIFEVHTTDDMTYAVANEEAPEAMRLNWNPGTMNLLYLHSLKSGDAAGIATDRPGLPGGTVEMGGTPTSSWVSPCGIKPDEAAKAVVMRAMDASDVRSGDDDIDYINARGLGDDALSKMWGVTLPDYTEPSDGDWGQTVAHEVGHVLGLRHRGNGGNRKDSHDGVNDRNGKGHPFNENVMCYGYTLSQDLDLVQTKCIRCHPILQKLDLPPNPPPSPAPSPAPKPASDVVELQKALGDSPADGVWRDSTERLAQSKMVSQGSEGAVVEWVQQAVNAKGFSCGEVDSKFGPKTAKGVREYQRSVGLVSDGDVGPLTLKKLAGV